MTATNLRAEIGKLHNQISTLIQERDAARRELAAVRGAPRAAVPVTGSPAAHPPGSLLDLREQLAHAKANPVFDWTGRENRTRITALNARIAWLEGAGGKDTMCLAGPPSPAPRPNSPRDCGLPYFAAARREREAEAAKR